VTGIEARRLWYLPAPACKRHAPRNGRARLSGKSSHQAVDPASPRSSSGRSARQPRRRPQAAISQGETAMRFMIIVKATKESEAGLMPQEDLIAAMATYHEALAGAGALLDASGLQPTSTGARIRISGNKRTVTDGPFTKAKELIAGYTIIQAASREEAIEWAKRMPNPVGEGKESEIELRQFFEPEDFGQSEAMERFRVLEGTTKR
jgi:hypothetical protein